MGLKALKCHYGLRYHYIGVLNCAYITITRGYVSWLDYNINCGLVILMEFAIAKNLGACWVMHRNEIFTSLRIYI